MNESDARQVLLVRAIETEPAAADTPALWQEADAAWAGSEARRRVGEHAGAESYLVARAALVLQRLRERDPRWGSDPLAPGRAAFVAMLLIGAALLLGAIVGNVLGPERRINLLAPPVWGLMAWNLLVYLGLAIAALRRLARRPARALAPPSRSLQWVRGLSAGLARWGGRRQAALRARYLADWVQTSAALQSHRLAAVMHAVAAALAVGVVVSMYLAGLAFDFRAGWDSTWLDPAQVERVLRAVFGPLAAIVGIELPDAAALARLRWAEGSSGESAARWIHLYALALLAVVIVPRSLLAAAAALRARRAAGRIALPLDEPYFRQQLRAGPQRRWTVDVLPYSYRLGGPQQAALARVVQQALGGGAEPRLAASLPLGAEDELDRHLPVDAGNRIALLFAATATPERETHGAFVQAVVAQRPAGSVAVLVDESGLRRQLGMTADASPRLQQRREAWQRMMQTLSMPMPQFIDLGEDTARAPR